MINAEHITKSFDKLLALDDFSMNVKTGSIYGLIGENGAGKTTVINHLLGVYKPDSGIIKIDGESIWENPSLKQKVLFITDEWYYFSSYTVKEMASFYNSIYKNFNEKRYNLICQNLNIDQTKQIRRLSKGMKKQVAFCIVLSCMPQYLILDEPLDGLDPVMRKQILNFIISDVSEREMTVLVSSHNLRELEDICDHVGIMHKGKMVIEKSLSDLKGDIHKIQLAFKDGFPQELKSDIDILHFSNIGSVYSIIARGDINSISDAIGKYNPIIFDNVRLTLEEVFIYELGGMGYDFKNIII